MHSRNRKRYHSSRTGDINRKRVGGVVDRWRRAHTAGLRGVPKFPRHRDAQALGFDADTLLTVYIWSSAMGRHVSKSGWKEELGDRLRRRRCFDRLVPRLPTAGAYQHDRGRLFAHRTRSVFDRYHIVSDRRLKEMASKLDTFIKAKRAAS
jgi:hypothetical protein